VRQRESAEYTDSSNDGTLWRRLLEILDCWFTQYAMCMRVERNRQRERERERERERGRESGKERVKESAR